MAGCTSNSNATLEPKYWIPNFTAAGVSRVNGWILGRGGVLATTGNPANAFDANRYRPKDTDKDLLARNFGSGASAIIGMELSVSRLKMSIETDLLQLGHKTRTMTKIGSNGQRNAETLRVNSPLDDFSCGLSYRVGIKLGNYFIPYVLVGMEYNFLKKDGRNPQFIGSSMIRYTTNAGAINNSMGERLAYSSDDRRIMQSPRLGAGLELEFLEHFRFRFDCLWTLRKRFNKKFTTEIDPSRATASSYFNAREHDVILRHKKFTTRFGIVMLF